MKKLLFIFLILVGKSIFAQVKKGGLIASKIRIDSLVLSIPQKTILKAEIIRCNPKQSTSCKDCETSDTSLIIKDSKNKVLLYKHDAYDPESRTIYWVFSQKLIGIGNVLAIQEVNYPTVASDQGSLTFYVLNSQGNLVQISPTLSISRNFENGELVKTHRISKTGKITHQQDSCKDCTWVLETKNFTGQCGFDVGQFFNLNLEGRFKNTPIITDSIPVYAEKTNQVSLKQVKNPIRITLYEKPFEKNSSKNILIKSNSSIRFHLAKSRDSKISILVTINGIKGYLQDLQELDKLGFPSCD